MSNGIMRVEASSSPSAVADAIHLQMQQDEFIMVQAMGEKAVNTGTKAIARLALKLGRCPFVQIQFVEVLSDPECTLPLKAIQWRIRR